MHFIKALCTILFILNIFMANAQVEVVTFNGLEEKLESLAKENDLTVVNFWATWCKPCIAELPYFEEAGKAFANEGVKLLLVNMDFVEVLDTKVKPFLEKRNIQSSVVLLDETDYNAFINDIDESWSGAIPATLFIGKAESRKAFFEKEFSKEALFEEIRNFLQD